MTVLYSEIFYHCFVTPGLVSSIGRALAQNARGVGSIPTQAQHFFTLLAFYLLTFLHFSAFYLFSFRLRNLQSHSGIGRQKQQQYHHKVDFFESGFF